MFYPYLVYIIYACITYTVYCYILLYMCPKNLKKLFLHFFFKSACRLALDKIFLHQAVFLTFLWSWNLQLNDGSLLKTAAREVFFRPLDVLYEQLHLDFQKCTYLSWTMILSEVMRAFKWLDQAGRWKVASSSTCTLMCIYHVTYHEFLIHQCNRSANMLILLS